MLSTVLMKLLTVKTVATAAAVTTVAGGVTAATVTMDGKSEAVQIADQAGVEASPSTAVRGAGKHDGTGGRKGKAAGRTATGPAGAAGAPAPSLVGLCHAVRAGNKAEHGKALQSPAFRVPVTTAGGTDRVDAYCTVLLSADAKPAKDDPATPPSADDETPGVDKPGKGRSDKGGSPGHPRCRLRTRARRCPPRRVRGPGHLLTVRDSRNTRMSR